MSHLIQPRAYTPRDATIFQQRPFAFIKAIEQDEARFHPVVHVRHKQKPTVVVGVGSLITIFNAGLTADTPYALVDKIWATTAPEIVDAFVANVHIESWNRWALQTKDAFSRATEHKGQSVSSASRLRVERLAVVQAALGFTTQDFAAVLGLSRPQLYRWLNAADDVRLQDAKRQRLVTVERLAKAWQDQSSTPLRSVAHEPLAAGGTVLERLTAEVIDEADVLTIFGELATKLHAIPNTRSQRLADAGFKRRPSVRSLPSDE